MRIQAKHPSVTAAVRTLRAMERATADKIVPIVTVVSEKRSPFLVLVSCLLSLRTKDKTTAGACRRLFPVADTPQKMVRLSKAALEKLIYPVGFYRTKAGRILEISRRLLEEYHGAVPASREELLKLKGVGRKTANLVLGLGFGVPAVCVDTHVHRISNRLGWVRTRTPYDTEEALCRLFPERWWIPLNTILVTFGQNICLPIGPRCAQCAIRASCPRAGVARRTASST
jgi:endonuclease-3